MTKQEKNKASHRAYLEKKPWYPSFDKANYRCNNQKSEKFKSYGGRGIKMKMSKEDVAYLWSRDKAATMKWATLDRIDSNGHYEIQNCRFIEQRLNSAFGGKTTQKLYKAKKLLKMASVPPTNTR